VDKDTTEGEGTREVILTTKVVDRGITVTLEEVEIMLPHQLVKGKVLVLLIMEETHHGVVTEASLDPAVMVKASSMDKVTANKVKVLVQALVVDMVILAIATLVGDRQVLEVAGDTIMVVGGRTIKWGGGKDTLHLIVTRIIGY